MSAATINGILQDVKDTLLKGIVITFLPQSAPEFSGATVICADNVTVTSDGATGAFAINLEPGYYNVSIGDPINTSFTIAVPVGAGPFNIGDLVTSAITPPPGFLFGQLGTAGTVDPTGVLSAPPGTTYVNTAAHSFWVKETGTDATGWQKYLQL